VGTGSYDYYYYYVHALAVIVDCRRAHSGRHVVMRS
jgi:hypothetical protein